VHAAAWRHQSQWTSWPFSFAGKISRAASRNKDTVAAARASHAAVKPVRSAARCDWTKQGLVEREVEIEELFHALGSRHCKNEAAFSYCGGLNLANSTQWLCTIMFKLPNRFD
jgi:hypothetical protein